MPDADQKRRRVPVWVPYTVLRVLFFLVPLLLVYGLGGNLLIAAVVATLVGFCLSLVLLRRQRLALAGRIADLRSAERTAAGVDEDAEDEALDEAAEFTPADLAPADRGRSTARADTD